MKKSLIGLLFGLLATLTLHSQINYVPNGSFEDTTGLDWGFPMIFPTGWDRPPLSITTPDIFITGWNQGTDCTMYRGVPQNGMGYSYPKSGDIYLGLLHMYTQGNQVDVREYIQAKLNNPLIINQRYKVGMYIKRAGMSRYALNGTGILLSDTAVAQMGNLYINQTPQIAYSGTLLDDSTNWSLVQGDYIAHGGEEYITIGNFKSDANSNITMVNPGGSTCWLTYYAGYYFVDSVFVIPYEGINIDDKSELVFQIYPNPSTDYFEIDWKNAGQSGYFTLSDMSGRLLKQEEINGIKNIVSVEDLPEGMYFLSVFTAEGRFVKKFIKKE